MAVRPSVIGIHPNAWRPGPNNITGSLLTQASRAATAAIAAIALAVLVSACLDTGDPAAAGPVQVPTPGPTDRPAPLEEFLGISFLGDDAGLDPELDRLAEEAVQRCMLAQGHEYEIRIDAVSSPGRGDLDYFSADWVAIYGFGITTRYFPQEHAGPSALGHPDFTDDPLARNADRLSTLSAQEAETWQTALGGDDRSSIGRDPSTGEWSARPSGCYGTAFDEVWANSRQAKADRVIAEFQSALGELYERYLADPQTVEYFDAVSRCVEADGVDWPSGVDPFAYFAPDLDRLKEALPETSDGASEWRELLIETQDREREIAAVVVSCGGGPVNERLVLRQIAHRYQQEFLDQHGADMQRVLGS